MILYKSLNLGPNKECDCDHDKVDMFMYGTRCKEWRWKRSFISSFSFFFNFFLFLFFFLLLLLLLCHHNNDASHAFWWLAKTMCTCKTRSHIEVPGLIKAVGRVALHSTSFRGRRSPLVDVFDSTTACGTLPRNALFLI